MSTQADIWDRIKRVYPEAGISNAAYRVAKFRREVPKTWYADLIELSKGTEYEIRYEELKSYTKQ